MYEAFFNLTMKPFELLPNPDFLFLSRSHRKVLMYLDYGIQERAGFILLTGPIGSGKTTIIRDLIKKRDHKVVLSKIFNTKVDSDQLLAMINDDFGLPSGGKDKITLLRELNDFLIDQFVQGNQPIVIIDEAQNLSVDLLEEIRMLSNLETDQAKLLQIILVGQPELRETLATPALMQLRQRMKINCTILPLTAPETEQYILHRLETAGNREAVLFSKEALETIFAYSRGIPRLINIICDFLMLAAFAEETRRIGREIVTDIIGDLDFENHFWGETSAGAPLPAADEEVAARLKGIRDRIDKHGTELDTFKQDTFPETADQGQETWDLGPGTRDQRPAASGQEPATRDQRPATSDQPPATGEQWTEPTTQSPTTEDQSPATSHQSPVTSHQSPVTSLQSPVASHQQPVKPVKEGLLRRVLVASGFKIFAALGCLFLSTLAGAADYKLHPSLTVGEEYTDNVFETGTNKREDYITRIRPGIAWLHKAPLWDWDINYAFDYRYYARGSRSDDTTHNLAAKGLVKIVEGFMFLDLSDTYSRVSLDVSRDTSEESLFVNQTDRNTFTASPYFLWRLGTLATLKTGYRYVNTWYREPTGVDKREQSAFADLTHEFSTKASVTAGYTFTHQDTGFNDYDKHDAYAGGRYEYADKSFVYAQAGNSWITYSTTGSISNPFWNAGITHDFDSIVASLKAGTAYIEDPLGNTTQETSYVADISKKLARGSLGLNLSYAELENTVTKSLQTRRYGGTVRSAYELLPKLTGTLAFTAEKYDRKDLGSYTRHLFVDSGLSYQLGEGLTVALNYKYIDYYSPGIATDNKQVNRAILEIRKTL
jgi:putative secretion ATPase (PEP-CTERM system associated)